MQVPYKEIKRLREEEGMSWDTMEQYLRDNGYNEGKEALRSRFRRGKPEEENRPDEEEAKKLFFSFEGKKKNIPWKDYINLAKTNSDFSRNEGRPPESAEVTINSSEPIAVVYTADWHLGDSTVDYRQWIEDIELICTTKNVYMMDLGDEIQNMRSFKVLAAVLSQVLTPPQQARLLKGIIEELTTGEKLLCKVTGNHDREFDERIYGQSIQEYLLEKMQAPLFENIGLLTINLGLAQYTNLVYHKSRFSSFMRPSHGSYRQYQLAYPADIVAGGHDHVGSYEVLHMNQMAQEAGKGFGGETFLIKVGSYQNSPYGRKYFHNGGRPMNPTVVMFPDKHKKVIFSDLRDALEYIK